MGSKDEVKKIIVDRENLLQFCEKFEFIKEIEVPELSKILGCENGQIPVLKVRGASLDDQIKVNELAMKSTAIIARIVQALEEKSEINIDFLRKLIYDDTNIHPKTMMEIFLFHRNVVEPKFGLMEVVKMSEAIPEVINRIAMLSLSMTSLENSVNAN